MLGAYKKTQNMLKGQGLRIFEGESLGNFLLTSACTIEKVNLWMGVLYKTLRFKIDEGAVTDSCGWAGNRTINLWFKA